MPFDNKAEWYLSHYIPVKNLYKMHVKNISAIMIIHMKCPNEKQY